MKLIKRLSIILLLLSFLCVISIGLSDFYLDGEGVKPVGEYTDLGIPGLGGDPPPGSGNCETIGQTQDDNPFIGWPVDYYPGNWNTITSWYCDPDYFEGYTHWGIDIGRLDWTDSILGSYALVTAKYVRVERASYCEPPVVCYNAGMGNNIKVRALDCKESCETDAKQDFNGDGVINPETCKLTCEDTEWFAYYFHLMDVNVSNGDILTRGDKLGRIDSSGNSTGHHLHYQINFHGSAIDPAAAMAASYSAALRDQWKGTR